jgi:hypothetical protein
MTRYFSTETLIITAALFAGLPPLFLIRSGLPHNRSRVAKRFSPETLAITAMTLVIAVTLFAKFV